MTEVRCNGCHHWFPAGERVCPMCGHVRPAYNKWLRTAAMNDHLYSMARKADDERRFAAAARTEREPR